MGEILEAILEHLERDHVDMVTILYKGQVLEMTREEAEAMADYARSWANTCLPLVPATADDAIRIQRIKDLALGLADMVEC